MRKARIVCTIGPSSQEPEILRQLIRAGMNVARLNFSHGDHETHTRTYNHLRQAAEEVGMPLAILQDLCGPKIRLGEMAAGTVFRPGELVEVVADPVVGDSRRINVTYHGLAGELQPGNRILIDDGKIELVVRRTTSEVIEAEVVFGGPVRSHKGVNLPGSHLSVPALTEKDEADLRFGLRLGVDWVALSFVRREADLAKARAVMREVGVVRPLMAKIEKIEALDELEEIVRAADGIMVARGDLGVEVAMEEVPLVQKRAIALAIRHSRPVITATQMLESMIVEASPTRAEVTDIANAILDGTDAVMLSAETASGAHPVRVVEVMDRIVRRTEQELKYEKVLTDIAPSCDTGEAMALAACEIAEEVQAGAILACTHNGSTIRRISRYRPRAPILALTARPELARQLILCWGVTALPLEDYATIDEMLDKAKDTARQSGFVRKGDGVVCVAALPIGSPTNFITYIHA